MNNFKRTRYEGEFEDYYASNRELFEALDMIYTGGASGEQTLKQMADCLIETAREQIEQIRFKGRKTQKQLDYNFMISVYLIPAIQKYPADFSEPFADCLVQSWNEEFGTTIGKASFDDINKGFRRKLCYVTTAICENLGKGPDCYELKTLKPVKVPLVILNHKLSPMFPPSLYPKLLQMFPYTRRKIFLHNSS